MIPEYPSHNTHPGNGIRELNIIDYIFIDHRFLKEAIDILLNPTADKMLKLSLAKRFLETSAQHSQAERKCLYQRLERHRNLQGRIHSSKEEHDHIDKKIRSLKPRFNNVRVLREDAESELMALAGMLKLHIEEEERETLPLLKSVLDETTLVEMGRAFMEVRKIPAKVLREYPFHQDSSIEWKDYTQEVSSKVLSRMDKFAENIQH